MPWGIQMPCSCSVPPYLLQESCPCCRKPVNQNLIFVIFKMSKSIGRMKIKCRNEIRGCRATFPLSEKYSHGMSCPFELLDCQHPGCGAQLLRRDMEAHSLQCEYRQQPCHMGCGTLLSPRTQAQHSCYQQLRQEEEAKREQRRAVVATLKRKMRRLQNTMERVKRQIVLICESLEIMDDIEAVEGMGEMVELEEEGLESGDSNASSSTSRSSRSSSSTSS
ncbi:RING finger protein 151 isoform X2 [Denticeps clupeoides]|uniref:RING finger protein 151 isoform X2 n=1 Tax=Denticeps clupeoides TaxID=299321 RepID=UPI0010A38442|nr:RING finger protein 151 isoform X2 [Denticeps clupeoides]